ncbi:MAG: hypothetical protein JNL70_23900 [Saprospiraceae bacterium]|nr:hypothetical protein [Saprospiraceae bacterium]
MKTIHSVVFFLLALFIVNTSLAQIIDPTQVLRRKAEQKLNSKINDTLEKTLDKAIDSALAKKTKSKTTTTTDVQVDRGEAQEAEQTIGAIGDKIGKIMDFDAKPKGSYAFSSSILQKITVIDKKKTETGYMKILYGNDQTSVGMTFLDANKVGEAEKGTIIMDMTQKAFFMFNTDKKGKKNYFGMRLKEQPEDNSTSSDATTQPKSLTPTGKHKTIMGYDCEGYKMDGEKGDNFIFWVTNSSVAGMESYEKAMRQYNAQQPKMGKNSNDGVSQLFKQGKMVLGHDYTSKDGNQMLSELEKISPNDPNSFLTEGYKSAFEK